MTTPEFDLLIKNVRVVRPHGSVVHDSDIAIRDGRFALVAPGIDVARAKQVHDGRGRLAFPGVVDAHMHSGIYSPLIEDAVDLISDADIVMVIGTSLKVYPAAGLVEFAPDDALCVLIDPHPNLGPSVADRELFIVEERAATGVPRVVQALLEQL